jgi:VWFA-related protein
MHETATVIRSAMTGRDRSAGFKMTLFYPKPDISSRSVRVLLLLFATAAALAQTRAPAPQGPTQTLAVSVTNAMGQYVPNLKAEDFILEEDGVRQQVATFTADPDLPISVGILIDTSTSMRLPVTVQGREKVPAALLAADGAARVVLKLTKPDDEYLIMTFNDKFSVKQSFTSDEKKVTDLLYKNNTVGGATHLYNAIGEALKEIKKKAKNPRRALVVLTDVHDTSGDKVEDLQARIREMEIPVFTFGMRWDAWGVPGEDAETGKATYEEAVLKMMAGESAGHSMVVDIPDLLSDYTVRRMIEFVQILGIELRGQYVLSYASTPRSGAKAIRLRTTSSDYQVRFRREATEKVATKK